MLAAADYAEDPDHHEPPPELDLAFQAENWGALPEAGGLRDQPAGLMRKMTIARNVYRAFRNSLQAASIAEWSINYPEQWALVSDVRKLRKELKSDG